MPAVAPAAAARADHGADPALGRRLPARSPRGPAAYLAQVLRARVRDQPLSLPDPFGG